jgi:hypothetical protein
MNRFDLAKSSVLLALGVLAVVGRADACAVVQTPAQRQAQSTEQASVPSSGSVARMAGKRDTPEVWFARMDRDKNHALSPDEFKSGLKSRRAVVYQRLPIQFRAVDIDHSGYLEESEFDALAMIEDAGADAPTLNAVDTSKDARIDFREFVALAVRLDPTKN